MPEAGQACHKGGTEQGLAAAAQVTTARTSPSRPCRAAEHGAGTALGRGSRRATQTLRPAQGPVHGAGFSVPGPQVAGRPRPCAQSRPSGLVVVRALPPGRPETALSCLQGLSQAVGRTGGAEGVGCDAGQARDTGRGHKERLRRPGYRSQPHGSPSEIRAGERVRGRKWQKRGHEATQRGSCGPWAGSRGSSDSRCVPDTRPVDAGRPQGRARGRPGCRWCCLITWAFTLCLEEKSLWQLDTGHLLFGAATSCRCFLEWM